MASEQEERLNAILENAVDAIIIINEHGIIELANPATSHMFGYQQHELLGANISILMPEPIRSEHDGYLHNYRATGKKKIIGVG
ncbi:MAG: PAS domain S-box protein, partial [bacterium]|nr:PAS domain S-box protein [bacterium]